MNRRIAGLQPTALARLSYPGTQFFITGGDKTSVVSLGEVAVALFSGGIDSPVACALVGRRMEIVPLYFNTYPYASRESVEAVFESMKRLKSVCGFSRAFVVPWRDVMDRIARDLRWKEYTCVLCKRAMLMGAELLCDRIGASAIVTGDSLGQKASQTLENLAAISHGIRYPILRPLLGLDKTEIEALSRKLGLWLERHAGGCTAVPKRPRTGSRPEVLNRLFGELGLEAGIRSALGRCAEVRSLRSVSDIFQELK